jgi:dTDP-glucose pyrophosphorylase
VVAFCRRVEPGPRGELELTAAVADMVAAGRPFRVEFCRGGVLDLTGRGDIAAVEQRLAGRVLSF